MIEMADVLAPLGLATAAAAYVAATSSNGATLVAAVIGAVAAIAAAFIARGNRDALERRVRQLEGQLRKRRNVIVREPPDFEAPQARIYDEELDE